MNQTVWDAVIVGGGPAGLSAAQALGRSLRRVLVIDAGQPRNRFAAHMHNMVGFDGVSPTEITKRGRAEAEAYGVEFRAGAVLGVTEVGSRLEVELDGGSVTTRALIVASGITDELPPIPGLSEMWGKSALHCPYCHGWEVRGKRIAVVTTSPMGMHQVKLVRQLSEHVVAFTAGAGELDDDTTHALRARGIDLIADPVTEIIGADGQVTEVRTAAGQVVPVDAVFTAGKMVPHDAFLATLNLDRNELPFGSYLAVDPMGRTSHPRIWAIGNVVNPAASVPISIGAGNLTGAAVNGTLVEEDFEMAARHKPRDSDSPAEFWERRYGDTTPIWSGKVNRVIADLAADWTPGRSLDLGCGEGGDVIWLAEHGWQASGIDLSVTATSRAQAAAAERGLASGDAGGSATFIATDLAEWVAAGSGSGSGSGSAVDRYDLITASFFQSPVELPRAEILRAAMSRIAPGGRLVLVAHASTPSWSARQQHHHTGGQELPTPESELAALDLDPGSWTTVIAEVRTRDITAPDGTAATLDDSVVVLQRTAG